MGHCHVTTWTSANRIRRFGGETEAKTRGWESVRTGTESEAKELLKEIVDDSLAAHRWAAEHVSSRFAHLYQLHSWHPTGMAYISDPIVVRRRVTIDECGRPECPGRDHNSEGRDRKKQPPFRR